MQKPLLVTESPRTKLFQVLTEIVNRFGNRFWLWIIWQVLYLLNVTNHAQIHLDMRVHLVQR